ncbi:MAG: Rho termination factor N-terminal domain-containing protein [Thermodesulfobacteriota bacterium]
MAKKERKEKQEKPLEKMTATELRKYALELGEITGVHGMNKEELIAAVKKAKGIVEEGKKAAKTLNVRELKEKIKELRAKKLEAREAGEPRQKIDQLRRRINRLKKRTRQAA